MFTVMILKVSMYSKFTMIFTFIMYRLKCGFLFIKITKVNFTGTSRITTEEILKGIQKNQTKWEKY